MNSSGLINTRTALLHLPAQVSVPHRAGAISAHRMQKPFSFTDRQPLTAFLHRSQSFARFVAACTADNPQLKFLLMNKPACSANRSNLNCFDEGLLILLLSVILWTMSTKIHISRLISTDLYKIGNLNLGNFTMVSKAAHRRCIFFLGSHNLKRVSAPVACFVKQLFQSANGTRMDPRIAEAGGASVLSNTSWPLFCWYCLFFGNKKYRRG